jgi:light-regulated signal transduction histidine kinase (bacteriophytochrome)
VNARASSKKRIASSRLSATRKTDHALIELASKNGAFFVRDNGAGFDPALAGKLFGAFQRLHKLRRAHRNGIGLGTVQRHDGKISAESEAGHGATFFFTLAQQDFSKERASRVSQLA